MVKMKKLKKLQFKFSEKVSLTKLWKIKLLNKIISIMLTIFQYFIKRESLFRRITKFEFDYNE